MEVPMITKIDAFDTILATFSNIAAISSNQIIKGITDFVQGKHL